MRKWLVLLVLISIPLAAYQHWDKIEPYIPRETPLTFTLDSNTHHVVMYSTSWCPYCQKAREFFDGHDIAYTEYDIEKSPEAKRQFDALRGRGVPLIVVGTEKIRGWNPTAVKAALTRLKDSATSAHAAAQRTSTIGQFEGYIIHLRNGRKIPVTDYWERGDKIEYEMFGGIVGVHRTRVAMIENKAGGTVRRYSPIFKKN